MFLVYVGQMKYGINGINYRVIVLHVATGNKYRKQSYTKFTVPLYQGFGNLRIVWITYKNI